MKEERSMRPPYPTDKRLNIPFLRFLVCVLFFPCFLLMDRHLPISYYYLAGIAVLNAALLYLIPSLNLFLSSTLPFTLFIDLSLITASLYMLDRYVFALAVFYLLPLIALSFNSQPSYHLLGGLLTGIAYVSVAVARGLPLAPVIVQIIIFFIIAVFTRFMVQATYQTYFQQINQDSLTKIHNRRYFNHILGRLVHSNTPFVLLLMDIDNFKNLNDTQGHHHGDYALKIIASILKECTGPQDIVARYGGDEFAVILPLSDKETGKNIAEKIRNRVLVNPKLLSYPNISLSLGISAFPADAETGELILQKSDEALYMAKRMGKNYVYVYHDPES